MGVLAPGKRSCRGLPNPSKGSRAPLKVEAFSLLPKFSLGGQAPGQARGPDPLSAEGCSFARGKGLQDAERNKTVRPVPSANPKFSGACEAKSVPSSSSGSFSDAVEGHANQEKIGLSGFDWPAFLARA